MGWELVGAGVRDWRFWGGRGGDRDDAGVCSVELCVGASVFECSMLEVGAETGMGPGRGRMGAEGRDDETP